MTEQFCTFTIDDQLFAVPVEVVQEILCRQETTPVPLAPPEVSGLLNLRGQIITTIDLRQRLGLPARDPDTGGVNVVVNRADEVVSLLVDRVGEVIAPSDCTYEPTPQTVAPSVRELVTRVYKLDDRLMLVLDTDRAAAVGAPEPAPREIGAIA